MTNFDPQIDLLLRFIADLQSDAQATPPPGLDEVDALIARDLARLYPTLPRDNPQRTRVWQHVLTEAARQKRVLANPAASGAPFKANGRHSQPNQSEEESMIVIKTRPSTERVMNPQGTTRNFWTIAAAAAIGVMVIGVLLLGRLPGNPPSNEPSGFGSGIGANNQSGTATPLPSLFPSMLTATELVTQATAQWETLTVVPVVTATPIPMTNTPSAIPSPTTVLPFLAIVTPGATREGELLQLESVRTSQLAWSADGQWLAVARGTDVEIYDADDWDGYPVVFHEPGEDQDSVILDLVYSPTSNIIAIARANGFVILGDGATVGPRIVFKVCECRPVKISFDPTGTILVIEGDDGIVRLWSVTSP